MHECDGNNFKGEISVDVILNMPPASLGIFCRMLSTTFYFISHFILMMGIMYIVVLQKSLTVIQFVPERTQSPQVGGTINTLGAEGFFIISVASAGVSAIFTHFQLKN
jgi:hypothetical protein